MRILRPQTGASNTAYEYVSAVQGLAAKRVVVSPLEFLRIKGQLTIEIELQSTVRGAGSSTIEAHCELAAIVPLGKTEELKTAPIIEAAQAENKREQTNEEPETLWPAGVRPFSYPAFDAFAKRKIV